MTTKDAERLARAELEVKPTQRGFLRAEFTDSKGHACSIQESSVVPCLWLGVDDPDPHIFPGNNTGWHPYPLPENVQCVTRMHLTQEQVEVLLPLLQTFVETGMLK